MLINIGRIGQRLTAKLNSKQITAWNVTSLQIRVNSVKLPPPNDEKNKRALLAKKYNLIPEDYIPYPPGDYFGDYPCLKPIGGNNRDPYEDFDDPGNQRNYGEVIHPDADLFFAERIDPQELEKPRYSIKFKLSVFFGFVGSVMGFMYFVDYIAKIRADTKAKHRQFPKDGPHYAFE